jgi:hypothetical protein
VKKFILLLTFNLVFIGINSYCQTPLWSWAKSGGSNSSEYGRSIAVDKNGNSYVVGVFWSSSINFGGIILNNDSINNYHDIFIVKYDSYGNVIWAKNAGGGNYDIVSDIAVDANGNTYVTGYFLSNTVTFGTDTLIRSGNAGMFVVKYDTSGIVLWARSASGGSNYGYAIAVDLNGNSYVTGDFTNSLVIFDSDTLTNDTSAVFGDIFIVKFDTIGNTIWAKSAGGSDDDYGSSIAVDDSNNIYVTGYFFSRNIAFGTDILTSNTAGNPGAVSNIFLVKYDAYGNVVWGKCAGGGYGDEASGVAVDYSSNIYITGKFTNSTIVFGHDTLTSNGGYEIFIVKYDASGNVVWAKSAGGIYDDYSSAIAVNVNSNTYISGSFESPNISFGSDTLINTGGKDIFVTKYDALGNVVWTKNASGNLDDNSCSIAVDENDNCYITGGFNSPNISFNSINLTNDTTDGSLDMFIARIGSATTYIKENNEIDIFVYPNPIEVHATLITESVLKNTHLIIQNIWGQSVKEIDELFGNSVYFNCDDLPSGLYCIRLMQDQKLIANKKIVINH